VVVIVFGVHSAVDWSWFVPANAAVAMLAAGWVVGRGPLRARLENPAGAAPPPPTWPHASRLRRFANSVPPLHGLAAALVLVIAIAAAWAAFQPVRAVHAGDTAFDRLDAGQPEAAESIATIATERNPLSVDPLFELAAIQQARGRVQEAQATLERAVRLEPASAEAWRRLGELRLSALNDPQGALSAFRAAYYLDPKNPTSTSDIIEASRAGATGAAPSP
jgi:tetratricopeptide (TPR) repeat protein